MPSILDYQELEINIVNHVQDLHYLINYENDSEIDDCAYISQLEKFFSTEMDSEFENAQCSIEKQHIYDTFSLFNDYRRHKYDTLYEIEKIFDGRYCITDCEK